MKTIKEALEQFRILSEELEVSNLETKIRDILSIKEDHDGKPHLFEIGEPKPGDTPWWIKKFDDGDVDFGNLTIYERSPEELKEGKYVATFMISGGKNGSGNWVDYLDALQESFEELQKETGCEPLLYKLDTDICDDVWTGFVFMYSHNIEESLRESYQTAYVTNMLTEGCWGMPNTLEEVNKLKLLMCKPVGAYEEGDCPDCKNDELGIGDDELFDNISKFRKKHGHKLYADVRPVIQKFIKDEVLPHFDEYTYAQPEGNHSGEHWEDGVKEIFQEIAEMDLSKEADEKRNPSKPNPPEVPVEEDIEKHDTLNPKLFEEGLLKPEVKEKVKEIVKTFLESLKSYEVKFNLKDVWLVGSNMSYNYTKDSDLDLHIIADMEGLNNEDDIYSNIYNAYASLFNKAHEIYFYGIPVEIYVESKENPLKINGIYSINSDSWIREPVQQSIPDIDQEALKKEVDQWKEKCEQVLKFKKDEK